MGAPKFKSPSDNLERNLRDKQLIEALRVRLNEKIAKDPKAAKMAALILERWINEKKRF